MAIFERAINGKDIATGGETPAKDYLTNGAKDSTYREGSATIQFDVLPSNATYNYTTNAPNAVDSKMHLVKRRRGEVLSSGKKFKP